MTTSELQLGNIISWYTGTGELIIGTVHGIEKDRVAIGDKIEYTDDDGEKTFNQGFMLISGIVPIIITDEWLTKLGYQYANENGQKFYWHIELPYFQLRKDEDSWGVWHEQLGEEYLVSAFDIDYVHQLQNIFFWLSGEELKIKE